MKSWNVCGNRLFHFNFILSICITLFASSALGETGAPTISSISPISGREGEAVTIFGSGFAKGMSVDARLVGASQSRSICTLGDSNCSSFTSNKITIQNTPSTSAGDYEVRITYFVGKDPRLSTSMGKFKLLPIVNVTSSNPDGNYGVGDKITIQLEFSKAITLSEAKPRLLLETGEVDRYATYVSGSGSSTIKFLYTVQPGDVSKDLDFVPVASLGVTGASQPPPGSANPAWLIALPLPGTPGSLSANKNIVIGKAVSTANLSISEGNSYSYPDTRLGEAPAIKTFNLKNSGDKDASSLTFGNLSLPFSADFSKCRSTLAAKSTCSFDVKFSPSATGSASAQVSIGYNDGVASQKLSLSLSGTGLKVLSPANVAIVEGASYNFSGVIAGGQPATKTFTLKNSGEKAATLAFNPAVSGSFKIDASKCSSSLAGNSSCTFDVKYAPAPRELASDFTFYIDWFDASSGGQLTKNLQLKLTGKTNSPAKLSVSAASDLGSVRVGEIAKQTYTLKNEGQTEASLLSFGSLSSPFSADFSNCGKSLAASSICSFEVKFSPSSAGSALAQVSVGYNDGIGIQKLSLSLSGNGLKALVPANVAILEGASYNFSGVIAGGQPATKTFTLKNSGEKAATLAFNPAVSGSFKIDTSKCSSSLAGNSSCTFDVKYAPDPRELASDFTFYIDWFDASSGGQLTKNLQLKLTGKTNSPAKLSVSGASDFGSVRVGEIAKQTYTLKNEGQTEASLRSFESLSSPFSADFSNCGKSLAASSICSFEVKFNPSSAGSASAQVSVGYYDGIGIQKLSLSLSGTGLTPSTLSDLRPRSGPQSKRSSVTIFGENLSATKGVAFKNIDGATFRCEHIIPGPKMITCDRPAQVAGGMYSVQVDPGNNSPILELKNALEVVSAPVITELHSPPRGSAEGGDRLELTGKYFDSAAVVRFGTKDCTQTWVYNSIYGDSYLGCVIPALDPGTYDIVLTNKDGQVATLNQAYKAITVPKLISFEPAEGPLGEVVKINGSGFTRGGSLMGWKTIINNQNYGPSSPLNKDMGLGCAPASESLIECRIPAQLAGVLGTIPTDGVKVLLAFDYDTPMDGTLTSNYKEFKITPPKSAPTITSISPNPGKEGDTVTISGSGFASGMLVDARPVGATQSISVCKLGDANCSFDSASITIQKLPPVPSGITLPQDFEIRMTYFEGTQPKLSESMVSFKYQGSSLPEEPLQISSIAPASAAQGEPVVVTGTGFADGVRLVANPGNLTLLTNGEQAPCKKDSSTQITCVLPALPPEVTLPADFTVSVADKDGKVAGSSVNFTYQKANLSRHQFAGQFTVKSTKFQDTGDFFDFLVGVPITYQLSFDSIVKTEACPEISQSGGPLGVEGQCWQLTTSPAQFTFSGDPQHLLDSKLSALFSGLPVKIRLTTSNAIPGFHGAFQIISPEGPEYFGFEVSWSDEYRGDSSQLKPFSVAQSEVILRRYKTPFAMTDVAVASLGASNKLQLMVTATQGWQLLSIDKDLPNRTAEGILIPKVKIRFDQKQTSTQQMFINGSTIYLSGRPFGFSSWDIGSNPISPRLQFAFSDNIESFAARGNVNPSWNTDYYASQAMGAIGRYVLTSGVAGASLLDTGVSNQVVELARHPIRTGNDNQVPADPNFIYKAIISDPNQGFFYGFTEQNGYVPLRLQSNDVVMQTPGPVAYSPNGQKGTCCVLGGATFQNNIFVAFRSSLRQFAFAGNGTLREVNVFNDLDASNIVASGNFLFIQHQAIPGNTLPSGIYIIDAQGNSVGYLPISPVAFGVSPDSNYLYANLDNDSITVYQINWQVATNVPKQETSPAPTNGVVLDNQIYRAPSAGTVKMTCTGNEYTYAVMWTGDTEGLPTTVQKQLAGANLSYEFSVPAGKYFRVECQSYSSFSASFTPH